MCRAPRWRCWSCTEVRGAAASGPRLHDTGRQPGVQEIDGRTATRTGRPGGRRWRRQLGGALMAALAAAALGVGLGRAGGVGGAERRGVGGADPPALRHGGGAFRVAGAAGPGVLACDGLGGKAPAGSRRWISDREWAWDLDRTLPPGVACRLAIAPGWKAAEQPARQAARSSCFTSGGPVVESVEPYEGSSIEEDQHWLLRLNGRRCPTRCSATPGASAGHRRARAGQPRRGRAAGGAAEATRDRRGRCRAVLVLTCQRPLPPAAGVRLVWGPGIAAANNPAVLTRQPQRFAWEGAQRFTAEFTCEARARRGAVHSAAALTLRFSEAVPRAPAGADPPAAGRRRQRGGAEVRGRQHRAVAVGTDLPGPLAENAPTRSCCPGICATSQGGRWRTRRCFRSRWRPAACRRWPSSPRRRSACWSRARAGRARAAADHAAPCAGRRRAAAARATSSGSRRRDARTTSCCSGTPASIAITRAASPPRSRPAAEGLDRHRDGHRRRRPAAPRHARAHRRHARAVAAGQEEGVERADLPAHRRPRRPKTPGATEVIGLPLRRSGYHVVEVSSRVLGRAARPRAPMYVRTGVLVTPIGVHQNAAAATAWSGHDAGPRAAGGQRRCRRQRLPRRDAAGRAAPTHRAGAHSARLRRNGSRSDCISHDGLFVTARARRAPTAAATWPSSSATEPRYRVVALRPADRARSLDDADTVRAHGVRPHAAARRRDGVDAPSPAPRECPGAGGAGRGGAA